MTYVWRFTNRTTGTRVESENLNFLMYQLIELRGFVFPNGFGAMLMARGSESAVALNSAGAKNVVEIRKVPISSGRAPVAVGASAGTVVPFARRTS